MFHSLFGSERTFFWFYTWKVLETVSFHQQFLAISEIRTCTSSESHPVIDLDVSTFQGQAAPTKLKQQAIRRTTSGFTV